MLEEKTGAVRISVVRDSGFRASSCDITVTVDGHPLAQIEPGEKISFFVEPGGHSMTVLSNPNCGAKAGVLPFDVTDGLEHTYRLSIEDEGNLTTQLTLTPAP